MTKWSTRKRLGHGWLLAVLSLAPPVYFGAPSNAGFLVAGFERQAAPPLTQQEVAQQLADLAASQQVFKLEFSGLMCSFNRLIPAAAKLPGGFCKRNLDLREQMETPISYTSPSKRS